MPEQNWGRSYGFLLLPQMTIDIFTHLCFICSGGNLCAGSAEKCEKRGKFAQQNLSALVTKISEFLGIFFCKNINNFFLFVYFFQYELHYQHFSQCPHVLYSNLPKIQLIIFFLNSVCSVFHCYRILEFRQKSCDQDGCFVGSFKLYISCFPSTISHPRRWHKERGTQ